MGKATEALDDPPVLPGPPQQVGMAGQACHQAGAALLVGQVFAVLEGQVEEAARQLVKILVVTGGKAMIGEALVAQGQTLVEYGVVASGALVFFAIGLRPVLERLRPTPLADGLRPGEIAAAIVAALASLALGLGAPLLEPQAEAIWDEHAVLLQLGALAVVLVGGMALSRLKRLPPGREQVARCAILPPPATGAWPRPALTGGDRLARALGVVLGRLGHGAIALSRRLVTGGAGEGVLWALALLGLGLIASFA